MTMQGTVNMVEQTEKLPIVITTVTGTCITIYATQDTIEGYYGNVNNLVNDFVKPLNDVESIVVTAYDEMLNEVLPITTYDRALEAFRKANDEVLVTYEYFADHLEPDYEQGWLGLVDGWLPRYGIRYEPSNELFPIITSGIERIEKVQKLIQYVSFHQTYKNPGNPQPTLKTPVTPF